MLHYMNLPRLAMLAAGSEKSFSLNLPQGFNALHELGVDLVYVMSAIQNVFEQIEIPARRLRSISTLDAELRGGFIYFSERYYAKNIPSPEDAVAGATLTGRIEKDPHIHFKWAGHRIILPVDPRWITTSTAFGDFGHRGISSQVKFVDRLKGITVGSPFLLGIRLSPAMQAMNGESPSGDFYDQHEEYGPVSAEADNKDTQTD